MKKLLSYIIISATLFSTACSDPDGIYPKRSSRVVFIYMAGDNSLSSETTYNLEQMLAGATEANMGDGKIVVYHAARNAAPRLIEIRAGSGAGVSEIVKVYDEGQDSGNIDTFSQVLYEVQINYPADSYALVLWSHGTGWLPKELSDKYGRVGPRINGRGIIGYSAYSNLPPLKTRYLNQMYISSTESSWMNTTEIAGALPDGLFDFIIFDLCYMGDIETCYEFRNKADYLVVSPAEVLANGMPYNLIIPHMFARTPRLGEDGVAGEYFRYYSEGNHPYATTAVIDCSKLEELAEMMTRVIDGKASEIEAMEIAGMQTYDRYTYQTTVDLLDFVYALHGEDSEMTRAFNDKLEEVVIYKDATEKMFYNPATGYYDPNGYFDINIYSGLATYVLIARYEEDLNPEYRTTSWYLSVYPAVLP